jgi:hypothetical protein
MGGLTVLGHEHLKDRWRELYRTELESHRFTL